MRKFILRLCIVAIISLVLSFFNVANATQVITLDEEKVWAWNGNVLYEVVVSQAKLSVVGTTLISPKGDIEEIMKKEGVGIEELGFFDLDNKLISALKSKGLYKFTAGKVLANFPEKTSKSSTKVETTFLSATNGMKTEVAVKQKKNVSVKQEKTIVTTLNPSENLIIYDGKKINTKNVSTERELLNCIKKLKQKKSYQVIIADDYLLEKLENLLDDINIAAGENDFRYSGIGVEVVQSSLEPETKIKEELKRFSNITDYTILNVMTYQKLVKQESGTKKMLKKMGNVFANQAVESVTDTIMDQTINKWIRNIFK